LAEAAAPQQLKSVLRLLAINLQTSGRFQEAEEAFLKVLN